jgi:dTDP-4-dehydrorhamnose reductase
VSATPATVPDVLLTGGSGQVGWELRRSLCPIARVIAPSRSKLSLQDLAGLRQAVRTVRPALVVNAAAFTAVDLAESQPAEAEVVNGTAPGVLAEECRRLGIPFIHFSTDYVFDGAEPVPRREQDPAHPVNVYGSTKLAGERAVLESGVACLIFRTSWVYGLRGKNFLRTMLRLARERDRIDVVDDQVGAPTWSRLIAEAVALVLSRCRFEAGFAIPPDKGGLFHLTAAGETSWYGFATAILSLDPSRTEQRPHILRPIPTSQYPTAARRPAYSVLDCGRAAQVHGLRLPDWEAQLRMALGVEAGTG